MTLEEKIINCEHDIEWIDGGGVSGSYPRCKKCGKIIKIRKDKLWNYKVK